MDNLETITATVGINSTTFTGVLSIGFIEFVTGDVSGGADEFYDIITVNGTQSLQSPTSNTGSFASSSFVTLDLVAGNELNGTFSVQRFDVQTVVPEPASLATGLIGLTLIAARRRR